MLRFMITILILRHILTLGLIDGKNEQGLYSFEQRNKFSVGEKSK